MCVCVRLFVYVSVRVVKANVIRREEKKMNKITIYERKQNASASVFSFFYRRQLWICIIIYFNCTRVSTFASRGENVFGFYWLKTKTPTWIHDHSLFVLAAHFSGTSPWIQGNLLIVSIVVTSYISSARIQSTSFFRKESLFVCQPAMGSPGDLPRPQQNPIHLLFCMFFFLV